MVFGITLLVLGYTLFYWGLHHMPGQNQRYSFWALLGFSVRTPQGKTERGTLFPQITVPEGTPVQWRTS